MYNRFGERVREGIGWIGDLGTGNGSPGSIQGPEDDSGNTEPDYHPGIGNAPAGLSALMEEEAADELDGILSESDPEPTDDITTDLVKENPFRYAGYYWDRQTQFYYLQARYYDPRLGRFISEDTYEGEIGNPQSLNQYVYAYNNPVNYHDPSGHIPALIALLGKALLNYSLDVMIGVGLDYLDHLRKFKPGEFDTWASIRKNAKQSAVPGLGLIKKISKAVKLADEIKIAKKAYDKKKVSSKGTGNSDKLPSQGLVDAGVKGAPKVDAGKRGKHVPGHGNNVPTKSQWPEGQNGVRLTQEAWVKGTPVKPDGSVKVYDLGKPVGPNGETRVKVHIDSKGIIHGYPVQ